MHIDLNVNMILESLAVIGIGWILRKLSDLSGSMGSMKVWQEQHEKQDNDRHETVMTLLERR